MLSARTDEHRRILEGEPLARAFYEACLTEVQALKPGNVSFHSGGHGMRAEDFVASAHAAAPVLAAANLGCGARILAAIEATRRVVACNTNLGIVLLAAPLACAAQSRRGAGSLRDRVKAVLDVLSVADAELAYHAIRLANPGGLGHSEQHDVADAPRVSLLAAMQQAAPRDRVARQYASAFEDVFEIGIRAWRTALARRGQQDWAAVEVYLAFLSRFPDSHVARKYGIESARSVSAEARVYAERLAGCDDAPALGPALLEWDAALKARGINPGTSADLTVATLFAARVEDMLSSPVPLVAARDSQQVGFAPPFHQLS